MTAVSQKPSEVAAKTLPGPALGGGGGGVAGAVGGGFYSGLALGGAEAALVVAGGVDEGAVAEWGGADAEAAGQGAA